MMLIQLIKLSVFISASSLYERVFRVRNYQKQKFFLSENYGVPNNRFSKTKSAFKYYILLFLISVNFLDDSVHQSQFFPYLDSLLKGSLFHPSRSSRNGLNIFLFSADRSLYNYCKMRIAREKQQQILTEDSAKLDVAFSMTPKGCSDLD